MNATDVRPLLILLPSCAGYRSLRTTPTKVTVRRSGKIPVGRRLSPRARTPQRSPAASVVVPVPDRPPAGLGADFASAPASRRAFLLLTLTDGYLTARKSASIGTKIC